MAVEGAPFCTARELAAQAGLFPQSKTLARVLQQHHSPMAVWPVMVDLAEEMNPP